MGRKTIFWVQLGGNSLHSPLELRIAMLLSVANLHPKN